MRKKLIALSFTLSFVICILCAAWPSRAQEQPNPKTLIPQSTLETIIAEVSGTLAYQHILELAGYEHDRLAEEYQSTYREAAYIEKMAKQYGLEEVHIERWKLPNKTWDGEVGELWMTSPNKRLIISYRDIAACLATGSKSADVTAELIYVGRGDKESDYAGKDVAGKIVLGSGSAGAMSNLAVRRFNAAGVVSFNNSTGKAVDRPDQIAWTGAGNGTFAFILSLRLGMELVDLLERGQKVTIHAKVKATEYDAEMQVPTAIIRGNGESQQEIAMTGHLFEGIAKQGAMDDSSGCATQLEIARAWTKLIKDGVLPRPRRTIRFIWVPEIQGTRAYLQRYPEETKRMAAAIAMDMVGEDVSKNRNSLHLMRTPYSMPNFINEVTQQFFEYVGDTNREKVHNRRIAYSYMVPILDPQGTRDQFYYNIDKHYGSSDHAVFISSGVPSVLFNNWPDIAYHTSEDRPFNADPTQLKRAAFIGLTSAHVMANADGRGAVRIAETAMGYAAERAATELRLALQMVGDGGREGGETALREALNLVKQAYAREAIAIRSAVALAENDANAKAQIEALAKNFVETGEPADTARVKEYSASITGVKVSSLVDSKLTAEEALAARLTPQRRERPEAQQQGQAQGQPQGQRGGGPGGGSAQLTGFTASEARVFADGKRSILDIRNAISAEYGPQEIAKVMAFFRDLEKAGEFELKERSPETESARATETKKK